MSVNAVTRQAATKSSRLIRVMNAIARVLKSRAKKMDDEARETGIFIPDWHIKEVVEILSEAVDHLLHKHDCDGPRHEEYLYAMRAANKWLKENTAPEFAWVPVSERLPGKDGWYEVSTTGTTDILNERVPFVSGDNFYDGEFDDPYVYAWRECRDPAPYKEATNE